MKELSVTNKKILSYFQNRIGEWVCIKCLQKEIGVTLGQSAANIRELKCAGYKFETDEKGRSAAQFECLNCEEKTVHYKYLGLSDEYNSRVPISNEERERVKKLFNNKDAFTGQSVSNGEVDHKTPHTVKKLECKISNMSDNDIKNNFQYISRNHNLLKDRACAFCKECGRRPPFMGMSGYYDGDSEYRGTCVGCGWYDGIKWRTAQVLGKLKQDENLMKCASKSRDGIGSILELEKFKHMINEEFPELKLKNIPENKDRINFERGLW